jgi:hypothetical protein
MTDPQPIILTCANHPGRETSLRCNRCDKPICAQCAVLTPTGYRCKECVKGQQKVFDTATWIDYPMAFVIAGVLSYIGSLLASRAGFFIILIAPVVGIVIAEAVRLATHKRRSRTLFLTALAGTIAGCLPNIIIPLLVMVLSLSGGNGFADYLGAGALSIVWYLLYGGLVCSSMYYRLSGIQLGKHI